MTAADGRFREDVLAEQHLEEWAGRKIARLWETCGDETPWHDATPENNQISKEQRP